MEVHVKASRKQRQFLTALLDKQGSWEQIGYGGARRGGKTDVMAMAAVLLTLQYDNIVVLLIRKGKAAVVNQYRKLIQDRILPRLGLDHRTLRYFSQPNQFKCLATGSEIHLGYLSLQKDIQQYVGNEYAFIFLEEATQHEEEIVDELRGSNRGAGGNAKFVISCNPGGGPGHGWVKERFVEERTRWPDTLWIKATPFDCPSAIKDDPKYIRTKLMNQPPWRQRQWIQGDWDVQAGSYWDLDPKIWKTTRGPNQPEGEVVIPRHADFWAGVDWGRNAPFAVEWMATWREWTNTFPLKYRDRLHIFEEIYQPGLQLDEQAQLVLEREQQLKVEFAACGKLDEVQYYGDWSIARPLEGDTMSVGRTQGNVWADNGWIVSPCRRHMKVSGWEVARMLMSHGVLTIDKERCPHLANEMAMALIEGSEDGSTPTGEGMSKRSPAHAQDAGLRYGPVSVYGLDYTIEDASSYDKVEESDDVRVPVS